MALALPHRFDALPGNSPAGVRQASTRSDAVDGTGLTVEFFGPAGAGKTTVARTLWANLRMRGIPVGLVLDGRASASGDLRHHGGLPLSAQAAKFVGGLRALAPDWGGDPLIRQLMAILPPGDGIRQIRIRRYAADLCRAWREGRRPGEVLILDQGFVTLLCSMALANDRIERSELARGLALVPRADLLIHVDAPRALLESRLQERVRRKRGFERLFGHKVGRWLRQADLASMLAELLAESGRPPVRVRSGNQADLDAAVGIVAAAIGSRRGGLSE